MQVTTSHRGGQAARDRAQQLARAWGWELVDRRQLDRDAPHLVVTREGLRLRWSDGGMAWHPGMLHALRSAGWKHPIPRLSGLAPGDRVLDTTLGLGTEARFLSELTGTPVVGLEAVDVLAVLTGEGLASVGADVTVVPEDSRTWLASAPDDAFDVVYADPLFPARKPSDRVNASQDVLRALGDPWTPDRAWVAQARRVARKAVVMKDLTGQGLLEALGAHEVYGRRRQRARYGVWREAVHPRDRPERLEAPMDVVIWHNPRCSKSRQTLKLLQEHGVEPTVRRYLDDPPTAGELATLVAQLEDPQADLVRRKEAKAAGIAGLEGEALLEGLAEHPRAIQRPVVIAGGRARLGRPPENVLSLL